METLISRLVDIVSQIYLKMNTIYSITVKRCAQRKTLLKARFLDK